VLLASSDGCSWVYSWCPVLVSSIFTHLTYDLHLCTLIHDVAFTITIYHINSSTYIQSMQSLSPTNGTCAGQSNMNVSISGIINILPVSVDGSTVEATISVEDIFSFLFFLCFFVLLYIFSPLTSTQTCIAKDLGRTATIQLLNRRMHLMLNIASICKMQLTIKPETCMLLFY
jgi:hypothetical protein